MTANHDKPAPSDMKGHMLWNLNAKEIEAFTDFLLKRDKDTLDEIVAIDDSERTFANTFEPLIEDVIDSAAGSAIYIPSYISPIKDVRDASFASKKKMSEYGVEAFMRHDVYRALKALHTNKAEFDAMHPEAQRMLTRGIEHRERSGLGLDEAERAEVQRIKQELAKLCNEFQEVVQNDDTRLLFAADELEGMSQDFLDGLTKKDGQYEVTLKYPDIIPISRNCRTRETRRKLIEAKNAIGFPENLERMARIVSLRAELAAKLNFDTYAAYRLADRMAKNPEGVARFYDDLVPLAMDAGRREADEVIRRAGTEGDLIQPYDSGFYQREIEEETFSLDHEAMRRFFPLDNVMEGIMTIVERVIGVKLVEVGRIVDPVDSSAVRPSEELFSSMEGRGIVRDGQVAVWHEDAVPYRAEDAATGELLGYLVMDLHPRPHRYSHACMMTLQHASHTSYPVIGLLANFPKPTADGPACMRHSDVETLLHEVGHCMHDMVSTTRYGGVSGTSGIEQDAVELPSQWLEGFVWDREALKVLGRATDGEVLPNGDVDNLIASRRANKGLQTLRQVFFGQIDQYIHTHAELTADNLKESWTKLRAEISLTNEGPGCGLASFAHLVGGYDSAYYGYLWADVLAADCRVHGIDDAAHEAGMKFRREVLAVGGARDAADSVRAYLGRDAHARALLTELGLLKE